MNVARTTSLALFVLTLLVARTAGADDPVIDSASVSTADNSATFSLGLSAQLRYELSGERDGKPVSAFSVERFRPILGFEAFEQIEARLVAEFADGPELRDAFIGWSPTAAFSVEGGQFAPPFHWERDGSSDFHLFTERSIASREFQIADGRDIGVQIDWEYELLLDLEVGVFNGAGSNAEVTPGSGHVVAGRLAWAPLGAYHEVELVPTVVARPVVTVAVGGYGAIDNAWRDWSRATDDTAPSGDTPASADVWSLTTDLHLWAWRVGVHTQGFFRRVSPCCGDGPTLARYDGAGFTGQASLLLIEQRLLAAFRYSLSNPDTARTLSTRETAAVLQVFHRGNQSRFSLDVGMIDHPGPAELERYLRLQYQLLL